MLTINGKERTRSWGVGEEDTEGNMWTSDRGRHTTDLGNELHGLTLHIQGTLSTGAN